MVDPQNPPDSPRPGRMSDPAPRPDPDHDEVVEAEMVRPVEPRGPADALFDAGSRAVEAGARVAAPFARMGWRGARGVGRRLGVNRAVERSADRALDRALESETVERAAERVLDSELVDRVWQKVLESEEAQQLVERVAEAPEVRSAIARQGVGVLEDLRRGMRRAARRLGGAFERFIRAL